MNERVWQRDDTGSTPSSSGGSSGDVSESSTSSNSVDPLRIDIIVVCAVGGAVLLGMVYNYLPYMVLPLYTIMVKIDNSVIEAAQDLGANVYHVVAKVLVPLSMPGIPPRQCSTSG